MPLFAHKQMGGVSPVDILLKFLLFCLMNLNALLLKLFYFHSGLKNVHDLIY